MKASPLSALDRLAPRLKEAELRVALALQRRAEADHDWTIAVSGSELAEWCGLNKKAALRAIGEPKGPGRKGSGLAGQGLVTKRRGTTVSKSVYRLEWMRTVVMDAPDPPPNRKSAEGVESLGLQGGVFGTPPYGEETGKSAEGVESLGLQGGVFGTPPPEGYVPFSECPPPPEQQLFDGMAGHQRSAWFSPEVRQYAHAELAGAARADRSNLIDYKGEFDQSINQVLNAAIGDYDPVVVAEAETALHGYMLTPHLCRVPNIGPPPRELLAQFLAVAPWPDLRALIYDLRGDRKDAYSYAFFVTTAAQRLRGIPPKLLKAGRKALSSHAGRKQHPAETPKAGAEFTHDLIDEIQKARKMKGAR